MVNDILTAANVGRFRRSRSAAGGAGVTPARDDARAFDQGGPEAPAVPAAGASLRTASSRLDSLRRQR